MEKEPNDMKFWTKDMVTEYDKFTMNKKLHQVETNYNFHETSWNPTIVQRFAIAVNQEYRARFPYKGSLSWDMKEENGNYFLEATVRTEDYGSLTVPLPIDKLRSPKCPKSLPTQLITNFIKNFEKKSKK